MSDQFDLSVSKSLRKNSGKFSNFASIEASIGALEYSWNRCRHAQASEGNTRRFSKQAVIDCLTDASNRSTVHEVMEYAVNVGVHLTEEYKVEYM